ncbi:molybdopterin-dependent oxidoreductase [Nocardioides sp. CFH 31398]|uniref:molybdopterin-dependent oxidoreductase n=1 Tax=Nocardioides sp. CFH 31398 TaxID=2919579 RepID=UPI001F05DD8D|nr:molybdopterin-dependent oxidoreductase [Nocardioides sp. CFH 31398]MCH1867502.1 molybdopterin-dependent oxidoreductase [Nocardioides sp. CFH 31398]
MALSVRAPSQADFTSRLHSPAVAARIGTWLGITFGVCFLTGLISHWAQVPDPLVAFPTRPTWGYRVTQGLHVITGTATIPLLLVKLWTVYPRLFKPVVAWPPRAAVVHGLERLATLVLVAAGVFQLVTGLMNSTQWYPWSFSFRPTHYAVAWLAIGAIVVHVALKLPVIRGAYARDVEDDDPEHPPPYDVTTAVERPGALSRRGLLRSTWAAAAVAAVATAGATVPFLRWVSVLGVRTGDGPQGLPINRSAEAAGVGDDAVGSSWRLTLVRGGDTTELTLDDLRALPQQTVELPIACVEGWSASATWTGPRMSDVMAAVGTSGADVGVYSLQTRGAFSASRLPASFADDPLTLLALEVNGETLSMDHGYPCRVIAPNRPGVLQTKWVTRLETL